jgi:DNA-binding SARP family transcriptional activator/tetratricopeptide (TPR) repeat protein
MAFTGIVFAKGQVSRPEIIRLLWGADIDSHTRQRVRQLVHATRRKAGFELFEINGEQICAAASVGSDVREMRGHLAAGRLLEAAQIIASGFLTGENRSVSDDFEDWTARFGRGIQANLMASAEATWTARLDAADWNGGRDAAEALYLLDSSHPSIATRVIEARARVGRLQSAEVAYSEHIKAQGRLGPDSNATRAIERARAAMPAKRGDTHPERAAFVGRTDILGRLDSLVREVKNGSTQYALVIGEAGIGKSRVLEEIARHAALTGVRALTAKPVELEQRITLNPLLDALSAVDLDNHLSQLGEPWRTVIGATMPPGSLTEPVGHPPPIDEKSLPRRLMDAFALLLESVASEQPTILFIDDLHWADATTVAALHFFRRRWSGLPLGVIATIRPEEVGPGDPLNVWLRDETRHPVERVTLSELEPHESRELFGHLADRRIDPDSAYKLLALAAAHPLYLTELTRDYLAGRLTLPASQADALTLPVSLRQILAARWTQCSDRAERLAHMLAVASRVMRVSELAGVLDSGIDDAIDGVDELQERGICVTELDRVSIGHDLFKSAIYADLGTVRQALLHRQLAEYLADRAGVESAGELGVHFDRAGERARAATYARRAGARAMMQGAVAEAAHFYQLVARNEDDQAAIAEATAEYATALYLGRDMRRADSALELAATRLRDAGFLEQARRMDIRRVDALAEGRGTPVEELVARLTKIKREATSWEDWEAVALALDAELRLHSAQEDIDAIKRVFEQFRVVSARGQADAVAVCQLGLAMGVLFGSPTDALRAATEAIRVTRVAKRHRLLALWRYLVVMQYRGLALTAEVQPFLEEARCLAATSGDVRVRFSIESNLASALLDAGRLDEAEEMLERSTKLLGSADMDMNRLVQANNHAELALARGDYQTARVQFQEAESYFGKTTPPDVADTILAGIGLCALETGDLPEARRRESQLGPSDRTWYCDPTTSLTFRIRLLERRQRQADADLLIRQTAEGIRGRLDLFWLKISTLHVGRLLKWGQHSEAIRVATDALILADSLGLEAQVSRLTELTDRASARSQS